jgi:outer membrane protein assembly factor BamB
VSGRYVLVVAAIAAAAAAANGCAAATTRRVDGTGNPAHPAGVLQIAWRVSLHDHQFFEPVPEECATGTLANGLLVVGSRAAKVVGVSPETGQLAWVTGVSGGVDSRARLDAKRSQVYIGTDDGGFYAFDPATGAVRWSYKAKGAIERAAEVSDDLVFAATAADRVFALDPATGKWRWQYEREMPDGFTIHGYSGPRLIGSQLLAGFADGYLVSLSAATGEVMWARSLAAASEQFVDVDSTPSLVGDVAYASSYSGGFYALDPKDGTVRWRIGLEGVGDVTPAAGRLYFVAPRQGVHAADRNGRILWRQGLSQAGGVTAPIIVGQYLVFSGSRAGMFVVDRENGALLEIFNPGRGVCAQPLADEENGRLYVLSNSGSLYALNLL